MNAKRISRAVVLSGALITMLVAPPISYAQEEVVEEIIVTGSHIRQDTFTSSSPITVLDSESIEGVGVTNVGDLLSRLPSITSAINGSSHNVNRAYSSGINTTALRNVGTARTLVLVNGRRFVSGTAASAGYGVDLNAIPSSIIDRVEVLTGGQSAAYGSDAVAGVVNIITKKDFDGVEFHAQMGASDAGGRERQDFDLTVGKDFSEGNVWFSFGYSNDEGLMGSDRDATFYSNQSNDTDGDGLRDTIGFGGSSFVPTTRLLGPAPFVSIHGDGSPWLDTGDAATSSRLNFNEYRSVLIPLERIFAAGALTLDVGEKSTLTMEMNYARAESRARFEPIPYSPQADAWRVARGGTSGIDISTSPFFIGSAAGAAYAAAGITDLDTTSAFRRTVEFGDRGSHNIRSTYRIMAALDYEFDNGMYLDVYGTYGTTQQVQTDFGDINLERAALSLDIEQDGFGGYRCVDAVARSQGCVPHNPFGTIDSLVGLAGITGFSPEAVTYLRAAVGTTGSVEQAVVAAVLSGDLPFSVGSQDSSSFALGLEYRDERGADTPDGLRQQGITRGYRLLPTDGSFDVLDVFAEVRLPLADKLSLDAAVRAGDYSSVGSTFTWKVGLDAPLNDAIRLRAAISTAVRAPNITDLFGGAVANAGKVFDPCDGMTAAVTGDVADNCRSISAIMDRITANGSFTLTQPESQNTTTFAQGSPTVGEEEADSFTAGVIFTPAAVEGLSIAVDYYDIEIKDAIRIANSTVIIDRCFNVTPGSFDSTCDGLIFRDPLVGPILSVFATANNEDIIETSGIDIEASYGFDLGAGDLMLAFGANFITDHQVTGLAGDVEDLKGEVLFPDFRFNLNASYNVGDWNVFSQLRYRDSTVDRNDNTVHNANLNNVDSVLYVDLRGGYQINDSTKVYVGFNNLFDEKPFAMTGSHKYFQNGVNTNGSAFDTTGRQWYAGITASF